MQEETERGAAGRREAGRRRNAVLVSALTPAAEPQGGETAKTRARTAGPGLPLSLNAKPLTPLPPFPFAA